MKKLFALLLALAMLLCPMALAKEGGEVDGEQAAGALEEVAAGEAAEAAEASGEDGWDAFEEGDLEEAEEEPEWAGASLVGTWYLNEVILEGQSVAPATFALDMTMELFGDGTMRAFSGEEQQESNGTWSIEGEAVTFTVGETTTVMNLRDGSLVANQEGMDMVFGMEKVETEMYEPAAPVGVELEVFEGTWVSTQLGMDGDYMNTALLGMDVTAVIDGTEIKLDGFVFTGEVIVAEYVDGELIFQSEDEESGTLTGITAQILADDTLALTATANDVSMVFIMEQVPDEE